MSLRRAVFGPCLASTVFVGLLPWIYLEQQSPALGLLELDFWAFLSILLLTPLASYASAILITESLTRSLRALAMLSQRFADGDYIHAELSTGISEIDQLSKNLHNMAKVVHDRNRYIRATAYRDQLTGLHNRAYLNLSLRDRMTQAREPLSLVTWSIDNLDHINEVLGYDFADSVLRSTARKSKRIFKDSLVIARLEGNIFSLLIPRSVFEAGCKRINLRKLLLGEIRVSGHRLDLECHAGVAHYPEHGQNPESLLRRADIARQIARRTHSPLVPFQIDFEARSNKRLALIGELKRAIQQREFEVFLQPKMGVRSGEVRQAEVLIRWNHPYRGILLPNTFIPLAEQTGLIKNITLWLFDEIYAINAAFAHGNIALSINISALDLDDNALLEWATVKHKQNPLVAQNITLEVTESSTMRDPEQACELLQHFANMGFKIAIDDFGSGYSSLAYLKRFPVSELKIDRSLVQDIDLDSDARVILQSTIEMGHVMGLQVTAEGVETEAEYQMIHELGADFLQGYWLSKPLPMGEFKHLYLRSTQDQLTQPA